MKEYFEYLKSLRKGKTGTRKIYSDSSLRNTNELALTTDVACMPGGGMGQLCNVIGLDDKHDEVIIHAGTNEIFNTRTPEEFTYTVEKTKEKLKTLAQDYRRIAMCSRKHSSRGGESEVL